MSINKKKCNFSFQHYNEILKLAKKQGYKFCFFSEVPDEKIKRFYMRHDVDLSLEKAFRLAQIEHQNKTVSTFFIRLDAPFFNIFDSTYSKIIKEITKLGHQIGLHFDENFISSQKITKKNIEKEVLRQIQVLKNYFNIKNIVSFHCPSHFVRNKRFNPNNFISVYDPRFFSKIKYLSESRGKWREGCVCKLLKSLSPPVNLQVLIHPGWWGEDENDPNKRLSKYLEKKVEYLDKSLVRDTQVYKRGSFYKIIKKK